MRAAKMDNNAKGRAEGTKSLGTQRTDSSLRAVKTDSMPRVMSSEKGSLDI